MKQIELKKKIEYSEIEIKNFLINNGYRIETHKFSPTKGSTVSKELALRDGNSEIKSYNDYKLIFEKLIKDKFENYMEKFSLYENY